MAISAITGKRDLIPVTILLIGLLSLIMLLGVRRLFERQSLTAALADANLQITAYVLIFHLLVEEVVNGETPGHVSGNLGDIDEAVFLTDFISNKSGSDPGSIQENADLKTRAGEIKYLLRQFKKQGLENLQNAEKVWNGSDADHRFDAASMDLVGKTAALGLLLERNKVKNLAASQRLFWGVFVAWSLVVVAATAGLWRIEIRRKRAEEALRSANAQLFSQAEELTAHRENLVGLVEQRTRELSAVNKNLRMEIDERLQTEAILRESERRIRNLSFQLLRVQEIERRRISMELHDELGQSLSLMKLRIGAIERKAKGNQPMLEEDWEQLLDHLDDMIDEVRRLSLALSPAILEDLGLTAAIHWLTGNLKKIPNTKVSSDIEEIDRLFHQNYRMIIYRVIQEALTNIAKYAQAKKVSVKIQCRDDQAYFSIEDDGNGFDPEKILVPDSSEKYFGLKTMNERVRMIGGIFDLHSRQGEGTRISFSIPIEK